MRVSLILGAILLIFVGFLCTPSNAYYNYEDEPDVTQSGLSTGSVVEESKNVPSPTVDGESNPREGPKDSRSEPATVAPVSEAETSGEDAMSPGESESVAPGDEAPRQDPLQKRQESPSAFGYPSSPNAAGANQLSPPVNKPLETGEANRGYDEAQQSNSPNETEPNQSANNDSASGQQQQQAQQQPNQDNDQQQSNGGSSGSEQSDSQKQQQEQKTAQNQQLPASSARGLGSFVEGIMNPPQIQQQPSASYQAQQQQQHGQPAAVVRQEDLPTIIENGRQQQPQQAQDKPNSSSGLVLPPTNVQPQTPQTNSNETINTAGVGPSSARTFGESWTYCQGESTGKHGTCKHDVGCKNDKGLADGSCMSGLGVCCVMALTCNDKSFENNTFFANPDFPEPSWEARLCEVEVKKKHSKILQIMIEFEDFELAPPNREGECITDVFEVKLGSGRPSPYSLLRICGQNAGQHLYLDVSQIEEPLILSVATSGGGFPRRWSIRIVQMDEKNYLLAPPGCLQYYTDTLGHFRSFNLGRNLRNLYYAICFRIDNGYSGIRFTSNFFGMNGPQCSTRKKVTQGGSSHGHLLRGGRFNHTGGAGFEAHPHHLVIPPMGYALPPPRPKYLPSPAPSGYGPSHPSRMPVGGFRKKRSASSAGANPTVLVQAGGTSNQQQQQQKPNWQQQQPNVGAPSNARTFDMKNFGFGFDKKEEKKFGHEHEFEHEPTRYPHHPSYPPSYGPSYGPSHGPGHYEGGHSYEYGSRPGPTYYPNQPYETYEHEGKKDSKFDKKDEKFGWKSGKKEHESTWDFHLNKFGWKSDKKEEKDYDESYDKHGHGAAYGHHGGYGHPPGPSGYGPPGYGGSPPGYYQGEYHHKEIDKFGKKYEKLEHKHELNHQDKEAKKDEKSWWFWQKKEEKKDKKEKEKFFVHHEALFPMMRIPEMPHCEPRFCGSNDVITFPPSGDSISEMCGNRFNRGRGPKVISGSPLVVYVSNRGHQRGAGFDMNYEQVFYVPRPY